MLLKELIKNIGLNFELPLPAGELEISDDFINDPVSMFEDEQIKIYCNNDDKVTRVICFDLNQKLILDLFKGEFYHGGTVYSFEGEVQSIIN